MPKSKVSTQVIKNDERNLFTGFLFKYSKQNIAECLIYFPFVVHLGKFFCFRTQTIVKQ